MWIIDYGSTWIKFHKVDKNKSYQYISPPTASLFFYLFEKVIRAEGFKKKETLIVGFPGVVKNGKVLAAPSLDERAWKNVNLQQRLEKYKMTSYVINDTDLHGHLVVKGRGVELVLSLDTTIGSSIFVDGILVPNTELGLHQYSRSKTYQELLSYKSFLRQGRAPWLKNLRLAIETLKLTFNPDKIYLTGSMTAHIAQAKFPQYVKVKGTPIPSKKSLKALKYIEEL